MSNMDRNREAVPNPHNLLSEHPDVIAARQADYAARYIQCDLKFDDLWTLIEAANLAGDGLSLTLKEGFTIEENQIDGLNGLLWEICKKARDFKDIFNEAMDKASREASVTG